MPAARRELLSLADAARLLDCSPRTVRRRISEGTLRAYRVGPRLVKIDLADVEALLRPIPSARVA
jgi:excisionase family DNA binding protein